MNKSIKKFIACFLVIAMTTIAFRTTEAKAAIINPDIQKMQETVSKYTSIWQRDDITGKYTYPVNESSNIWNELNHGEKAALCNIPDYVLNDISDEELVELVLNYPLLLDTIAYDSFGDGLINVSNNFKGLKIVLAKKLLENYSVENSNKTRTMSIENNGRSYFLFKYNNQKIAKKSFNLFSISLPTSVQTPNGTNVGFMIRGEQLSASTKVAWNNYVRINFPNTTLLSVATSNYNCHSYAWYSQSPSSNLFWINDPSAYMTDGSYTYVGTNPTGNYQKVFYNYTGSEHSGIVTNYSSKQITSKWGEGPLVSHNIYDCPYFYFGYDTNKIECYQQ